MADFPHQPIGAALIGEFLSTSPDIIYVYDLIAQCNRYVSRSIATALGYSPEDIEGMGSDLLPQLIHPEDLPRVLRHRELQRFASDGAVSSIEYRIQHCSGAWRWLLSREVVFERQPDGVTVSVFGIAQDITERKQTTRDLEESRLFITRVLDLAPHALRIFDFATDRSVYVNAAFATLFGFVPSIYLDIPGIDLRARIHPEDRPLLAAHIVRLMHADDQMVESLEYRMHHADGTWRWIFVRDAVFKRHPDGNVWQVIGSAEDITERKQSQLLIETQFEQIKDFAQRVTVQRNQLEQANHKLAELAITDGLTGLLNHRTFHERCDQEFRTARRYRSPLSLLMLDVDHFKRFNDTFGHPTGDRVLQLVAQRLHENARETDTVARYGGEEFGVVLPSTDLIGATRLAERIRAAIYAISDVPRQITVSIGVAVLNDTIEHYSALLDAADRALYTAKASGRNRVFAAPVTLRIPSPKLALE